MKRLLFAASFTLAISVPPEALSAQGMLFRRGESNCSGDIDISDPVFTFSWLFLSGSSQPCCLDAADANDDGTVDISDPVYLLGFLFLGYPSPRLPFPNCGVDPTEDLLACASFPLCPQSLPRALESPPDSPPASPCHCGGCSLAGPGAGDGPLNSVYLHSGEFFHVAVDLRIRGRGIDFIWARKYRSRFGPGTAQGNGWDFSYNVWIERNGQDVVLHDGNTRKDVYRLEDGGTYGADEFHREGRFEDGDHFKLTFADGGSWTFHPLDDSPAAGKLVAITDRNGNEISLDYDAQGRLVAIHDSLHTANHNRDIEVSYNSDGFISAVTDFTGRSVTYEYYDGVEPGGNRGDLKSARSPAVTGTPNGNDFPEGKTTVYTYSAGLPNDELNHNLLSITDPKGQTYLRNTYAATVDPSSFEFDHLAAQVWGDAGDLLHVVYIPTEPTAANNNATVRAIVNDRAGNVSEHFFDHANRCVMRRQFTGRAPDPDGPTAADANRPAGKLRPSDPDLFETRYSWNADARLTEVVFPNGNSFQNVYELALDPQAPRRLRGNLRERRRLPGPLGGDQPLITETFEYAVGVGGGCCSNFVSRHVDARGRETRHTYDEHGNRLQTIHRMPFIVEEFEYNEFGQLTRQIHPDNGSGCRRVDTLVYYGVKDGHQYGFLRQEITDAENTALTTTYEYDLVGNPVRIIDARGHDELYVYNALDQRVRHYSRDVDGSGLRYERDWYYDENDNIIRVDVQNVDHLGQTDANSHISEAREYDILNLRIRRTQEVGPDVSVITEWEYDGNQNRTLVRDGEATNGNQPTNVVRTVYDERDLRFRVIRAEGDVHQSTHQYDYDGNGNCTRIVFGLEAGGRERRNIFDGYGRLVGTVDPMGNRKVYHYDANGNLSREFHIGELIDVPGGNGNRRLYEQTNVHDAMDRTILRRMAHFDLETMELIGDGESVTSFEYSDNSQVVRVVDDNGNDSAAVYDCAHRMARIVDANGNSLIYEYDGNSNTVAVTEVDVDAGGQEESFSTLQSFDNLDRLVQTTDSLGNVTTYAYDSRDNRRRQVDPLGNVIEYAYDGLDRLLRTTRLITDTGDGAGTVTGTMVTQRAWDDSSRRISETDPNGNTTFYTYDALGRLVSTIFADGTIQSYLFDPYGDEVHHLDANGSVVDNVYDLNGRLVERYVQPGPGVSDDTTFEIYRYDGESRLVETLDDDSTLERSYDSLSNTIREELNGVATSGVFDGVGNRLVLRYPGGRSIASTYDALNRRKTIFEGGSMLAAYDYIGPGRVARRQFSNGAIETTYGYDGLGRMIRTSSVTAQELIEDRSFAWDGMHNRVRRTDLRPAGPGYVHRYAYDSSYRLREALDSAGSENVASRAYTLDGAGNRVSVVGGRCPGKYVMAGGESASADIAMNQYTGTPCDAREYDENGNLVLITRRAGGREALAYDYRDQLVERILDKRSGERYGYDVLGRRISRRVFSPSLTETTEYYYDGWQVIEERSTGPAGNATYVYGLGIDDPIGMRRGNGDYFFFADSLGSIMVATDGAGAVVERYDYGDFGMPTFFDASGAPLEKSAIFNPYLFAGRRYDDTPVHPFYYLRKRYLDPLAGRFITRDPIGIWEDRENLGNGVTYVTNNPQTLVDPSGTTTRHCGGPWPGPKTIDVDFDDCFGREQVLTTALCPAFRSMGQAYSAVRNLVNHERWRSRNFSFYYPEDIWLTRRRVDIWFGGSDNRATFSTIDIVRRKLKDSYHEYRDHEVDFECERSSTGRCSGTIAYVLTTPWSDLHFCPAYFQGRTTPLMIAFRAAVMNHEMTHYASDTDDFGTLPAVNIPPLWPFGPPRGLSERQARNDALTYELFLGWYWIIPDIQEQIARMIAAILRGLPGGSS